MERVLKIWFRSCWLLLILFAVSCGDGRQRTSESSGVDSFRTRYARNFRVESYDGYKVVEMVNPWDTARLLHRYVLVDRDAELPDHLPEGDVLRVPLQRVAVYSSVHCGMLEELGREGCIVGVCEPEYIALDFVQQGVGQGSIANLGSAASPDLERMVAAAPEAILVSPFEHAGYGRVEKMGIPIVECADYMESTPLGRTEWIRLMGLFFGAESKADSLFDHTEAVYDSLRNLAVSTSDRPTVITARKYGAARYVPGGNSYIGVLLRDAGADYLWHDDTQTGSVPLSFESVFERGQAADFWLFKYNAPHEMTYEMLQSEYEPYRRFAAFEKHNIFVCNTGTVPYYEEMPLHPDRVLRDLILIFHPELLPGETLRYYRKMKDE